MHKISEQGLLDTGIVIKVDTSNATHSLTHSERSPQNIDSQEEINLYCIIKLATEISYYHYKTVKLDVLCRQNKI